MTATTETTDRQPGELPSYVPDWIKDRLLRQFPDPEQRENVLIGPVRFFGNQSLLGVIKQQRWPDIDLWLRAREEAL